MFFCLVLVTNTKIMGSIISEPKDAGQYECEFNFVDGSSVTKLVQPVNLNGECFSSGQN